MSEDIIRQNWDRLLSELKESNIAIQAMFREIRNFSIDKNKLVFYLDGKRKWHKDHLSKNKNASLIQEVVKSVTGKNFHIVFDLKDDYSENGVLIDNDKENGNEPAYKYLEDKFKVIKEYK